MAPAVWILPAWPLQPASRPSSQQLAWATPLIVDPTTYVRPIRRYEGVPNTGREGMVTLALAARQRAYERWGIAESAPSAVLKRLQEIGRRSRRSPHVPGGECAVPAVTYSWMSFIEGW